MKTWFNVIKAGRIVDCVKANTIGMALQAAMETWDRACERQGQTMEVLPMPPRVDKLVVKPTRVEIEQITGHVPFVNPVAAALGIK